MPIWQINGRISIVFAGFVILAFRSAPANAQTQDILGTSFGIPTSSPGVFWPRGMSLESLRPENLYPDGPQFGLGTTAGGFGSSGTGALSGVGLAQRSVSNMVRREMSKPYSFDQRLSEIFHVESVASSSLFAAVLASRSRREIFSSVTPDYLPGKPGQLIVPYSLPSVDSILQDRSQSTDSILNGSFR